MGPDGQGTFRNPARVPEIYTRSRRSPVSSPKSAIMEIRRYEPKTLTNNVIMPPSD
jgi:hypothetical protein